MTTMHTYKGYELTASATRTPPVAVFDARYPRDPALYKAYSLQGAEEWVDAYIKGEAWAVEAKRDKRAVEEAERARIRQIRHRTRC